MQGLAPVSGILTSLARGGPGPRIVIKDSIDVAGLPTRCGSRAFEDAAPAIKDAAIVSLCIAGGAQIVGKARMHELAYGVTGLNGWSGTPLNPAFPDYVPGGSSSGSAAAVACGDVEIGIGTDTGGSIRVPAACCGVVGFKPTFGFVSRVGVLPAYSSLDCVGPLARSVGMIETAMKLIAPEYRPQEWKGAMRLGRVDCPCEPEASAVVDDFLHRSGLAAEPVRLPSMESAFDAGLAIIAAEAAQAFGSLDPAKLGPDVAARLAGAAKVSGHQLAEAEACRTLFTSEVDAALATCSALVLPTLPCLPPTLEEAAGGRSSLRLTALVRPFNLSGHPAISLPARTRAGAPAGIQLVGRKGEDAGLIALAAQVERFL